MDENKPILALQKICKSFPGVMALNNVDFDLRPGEVHALLGENGAGKSTLIKIITGAYQNDSGTIVLFGEKTQIRDAIHAQELGVRAVYQEFNLVPQLNTYENIFLMKQPQLGSFIKIMDKAAMRQKSRELLDELGIEFDINLPIRTLSVAYQQMVEISKALAWDAKIIIFDEPTAVLTEDETQLLFQVIRKLKEKGVGIIYISHRMEEIFQIADRVTVLRDGTYIDTLDMHTDEITIDMLISKMVGRQLVEQYPKVQLERGEEILRVEDLSSGKRFSNVSFSLYKGEILGITGLVGAGRTELAKTIFGALPKTSGQIYLQGNPLEIKSPSDAIKAGISLAPEDRKSEGLIQILSIEKNIIMANQDRFSAGGVFNAQKISETCTSMIESMNIKTDSAQKQVRFLSGGNQQKVVLAKWLATNSKVIIFDEPTRGIDVGAKVEVYNLINELVQAGVGIIIISSELSEILGMSDRILVMHEGKMTAQLERKDATQEIIMKYATI